MAHPDISLMNAVYPAVPAIDLPINGGGTARFMDTTDANATASDIASGKTAYVNSQLITGTGTGGSGNWQLLANKSLGTISTSNTSAEDTGQTVSVQGINNYDLLVAICFGTGDNGKHLATITPIYLYNSSDISTKSTATVLYRLNYKKSSNGTVSSRVSSTQSYGIYINTVSIGSSNNGTATLAIYKRYNNTYTGTVNSVYTCNVYGIKLTEDFI